MSETDENCELREQELEDVAGGLLPSGPNRKVADRNRTLELPDACITPAAPSPIPIPYPTTGKA